MVFLALELLSLCLYSLAAYHRRLAISGEAAIKYFLMGAFVSAFVLYGIALVYGATGSTRFDAHRRRAGRRAEHCRCSPASASCCWSRASASR